MLRIRLSRVGKRKQPAYRLVVTDSRNPREGAHLEIVGHYNPLTNPATLDLKEERLVHWLQVGARPSDTAAKLLTKAGVMERAGRAPVVYEGKLVPPAETQPRPEDKPATTAAAVAAPPAKAAEPPAEEAVEQSAEAPAPTEAQADEAPADEEAAAEEAVEAAAPAEAQADEAEAPADEPAAETPVDETAEETEGRP